MKRKTKFLTVLGSIFAVMAIVVGIYQYQLDASISVTSYDHFGLAADSDGNLWEYYYNDGEDTVNIAMYAYDDTLADFSTPLALVQTDAGVTAGNGHEHCDAASTEVSLDDKTLVLNTKLETPVTVDLVGTSGGGAGSSGGSGGLGISGSYISSPPGALNADYIAYQEYCIQNGGYPIYFGDFQYVSEVVFRLESGDGSGIWINTNNSDSEFGSDWEGSYKGIPVNSDAIKSLLLSTFYSEATTGTYSTEDELKAAGVTCCRWYGANETNSWHSTLFGVTKAPNGECYLLFKDSSYSSSKYYYSGFRVSCITEQSYDRIVYAYETAFVPDTAAAQADWADYNNVLGDNDSNGYSLVNGEGFYSDYWYFSTDAVESVVIGDTTYTSADNTWNYLMATISSGKAFGYSTTRRGIGYYKTDQYSGMFEEPFNFSVGFDFLEDTFDEDDCDVVINLTTQEYTYGYEGPGKIGFVIGNTMGTGTWVQLRSDFFDTWVGTYFLMPTDWVNAVLDGSGDYTGPTEFQFDTSGGGAAVFDTLDHEATIALTGVSVVENASSIYTITNSATEITLDDGIRLNGKLFIGNAYPVSIVGFDTIAAIGDLAFQNATFEDTELVLSGLESIGIGAFSGSNVTSVDLSGSTINFGVVNDDGAPLNSIFAHCADLESVDLSNINRVCRTMFWDCPALENVNLTGVELVDWGAFYGCTSLESVVVEDATSIGSYAFYNCDSLADVSFGENLTEICDYAFAECDSLAGFDLSNTQVWAIGQNAFENCDSLDGEQMNFGNAEYLGYQCFKDCSNLGNVDLQNVTWVGQEAFYDTNFTELKLDNVIVIGQYAFAGWNRTINIDELYLPPSLCEMGNDVFANVNVETLTIGSNTMTLCTFGPTYSEGQKGYTVDTERWDYCDENGDLLPVTTDFINSHNRLHVTQTASEMDPVAYRTVLSDGYDTGFKPLFITFAGRVKNVHIEANEISLAAKGTEIGYEYNANARVRSVDNLYGHHIIMNNDFYDSYGNSTCAPQIYLTDDFSHPSAYGVSGSQWKAVAEHNPGEDDPQYMMKNHYLVQGYCETIGGQGSTVRQDSNITMESDLRARGYTDEEISQMTFVRTEVHPESYRREFDSGSLPSGYTVIPDEEVNAALIEAIYTYPVGSTLNTQRLTHYKGSSRWDPYEFAYNEASDKYMARLMNYKSNISNVLEPNKWYSISPQWSEGVYRHYYYTINFSSGYSQSLANTHFNAKETYDIDQEINTPTDGRIAPYLLYNVGRYNWDELGSLVVDEGFKVLYPFALWDFNVRDVTLPSTLEVIHHHACGELGNYSTRGQGTISELTSAKYIGYSAFWSCYAPFKVDSDVLWYVGGNAFEASTIKAFRFPSTLRYFAISQSASSGGNSMTNARYLEEIVFDNCDLLSVKTLPTEYGLPSSIGDRTFADILAEHPLQVSYCISVRNSYSDMKPDVKVIGNTTGINVPLEYDQYTNPVGGGPIVGCGVFAEANIGTLDLSQWNIEADSDGSIGFGLGLFYKVTADKLVLPEGVDVVGSWAFHKAVIGEVEGSLDNITKIGSWAFEESNVPIEINGTLDFLGTYAFKDSHGEITGDIALADDCIIGFKPFDGSNVNLGEVTVSADLLSNENLLEMNRFGTTPWSTITSGANRKTVSCYSMAEQFKGLEADKVVITGDELSTGYFWEQQNSSANQFVDRDAEDDYMGCITGYVPQTGIANPTLSVSEFYNIKAKEVEFHGLKYLPNCAFEGNTTIEKVTFDNSLECIGFQAFNGATNLKEVVIPHTENPVKIMPNAFENTGIESLVSNEFISAKTGTNTSAWNVDFDTVALAYKIDPTSATYNGLCCMSRADWEAMDNTDTVVLVRDDTYTSVLEFPKANWFDTSLAGYYIFDGRQFNNCDSLTRVEWGRNLGDLSDQMFEACHNLQNVQVSRYLNTIKQDAFKWNDSLQRLIFWGIATAVEDENVEAGNLDGVHDAGDMTIPMGVDIWCYSTAATLGDYLGTYEPLEATYGDTGTTKFLDEVVYQETQGTQELAPGEALDFNFFNMGTLRRDGVIMEADGITALTNASIYDGGETFGSVEPTRAGVAEMHNVDKIRLMISSGPRLAAIATGYTVPVGVDFLTTPWTIAELPDMSNFANVTTDYDPTDLTLGDRLVTFSYTDLATGNVLTDTVTVTVVTKYNIEFQNWDGSSIGVYQVANGLQPVAPTEVQMKPKTGHHFVEWEDVATGTRYAPATLPVASADTVYRAVFGKDVFTIQWKDWDGTTLKTEFVEYMDAPLAPDVPAREGYKHTGWTPVISVATQDVVYTTLWDRNTYLVTFMDYDNSVISQEPVEHGAMPVPPANPTREGHTFKGWTPNVRVCTEVTTYKAVYEIDTFNIRWLDRDGSIIATTAVPYGEMPIPSVPPAWIGHTLTGWTPVIVPATEDTSYTTVWDVNTFDIQFVDYDGTVLSSQVVAYGDMPAVPAVADRPGFVFTGFAPDVEAATKNQVYVATYVYKECTVTFVDWDDTVLGTDTVLYGMSAVAPVIPVREGYTFTGWDKPLTNIIVDITVKALYTENAGAIVSYVIKGSVKFNNSPESGIDIAIGGAANLSASTDADGKFLITTTVAGDYTITVSKGTVFYTGTLTAGDPMKYADVSNNGRYSVSVEKSAATLDYTFSGSPAPVAPPGGGGGGKTDNPPEDKKDPPKGDDDDDDDPPGDEDTKKSHNEEDIPTELDEPVKVAVRACFEGEPLIGVLVEFYSEYNDDVIESYTDDNGKIAFVIVETGDYGVYVHETAEKSSPVVSSFQFTVEPEKTVVNEKYKAQGYRLKLGKKGRNLNADVDGEDEEDEEEIDIPEEENKKVPKTGDVSALIFILSLLCGLIFFVINKKKFEL